MGEPRFWALVPAAGLGSRFGGEIPKQYCELAKKPLISHVLETLGEVGKIQGIVVGLAREDCWWGSEIPGSDHILGTYTGGYTRAETVLLGLEYLSPRTHSGDWILVHDAARPCIRALDVERLIEERGEDNVGALLAVPVSDTVKQSTRGYRVDETVSRKMLWYAQTPQLFPFEALRNTLRQSDLAIVTDEASAMEAAGYKPRLVRGRVDNLKVTTSEDLDLASIILRARNQDRTP